MIQIHKILGTDDGAYLVLQVHDELVFEMEESRVKTTLLQVRACMESVADLGVPLVVEAKIGKNWGGMTKV